MTRSTSGKEAVSDQLSAISNGLRRQRLGYLQHESGPRIARCLASLENVIGVTITAILKLVQSFTRLGEWFRGLDG